MYTLPENLFFARIQNKLAWNVLIPVWIPPSRVDRWNLNCDILLFVRYVVIKVCRSSVAMLFSWLPACVIYGHRIETDRYLITSVCGSFTNTVYLVVPCPECRVPGAVCCPDDCDLCFSKSILKQRRNNRSTLSFLL